MNRRAVGIAGLALAAAAAGFTWAMQQLPGEPDVAPQLAQDPPASAPEAPAVSRAATAEPATERTAGTANERSLPPAPASAQGFRGSIIDEAQRPLGGLDVYLVDSAGNEPAALPLLSQHRHAFGPVASTRSAGDGTFALGLPVVQERVYELYVLSPSFATARIGGLRLLAGEWHELGAITMGAGATVRGRVTVAGRDDIPVPQAVVTVEIGAAFADAALRALPGAGPALTATVDASGAYELRHVPSRGIVQVAAVAPGFARVLKTNIELTLDRPVQVDFGLPPGESLGGTVTASDGRAIAGARMEAWPRQGAGQALVGHSDDSGAFQVLGLVAGPHRLRVIARGFELHDEPDVQPGRQDLRIVLHARSSVRVRVLTPAGDVVRSYRLGLRRYFEDQRGQIAAVADVPEQRVRLDGMSDSATIGDVPPGTFVCQVEAEGFAKTLSAPINNNRQPGAVPGPRQFDVTITLTPGAALRGVVLDENGAPLAGATVATQTDGAMPDNPFFQIVAATVPDRITPQRVTTGADGSFLLKHLAFAEYQLLVEHPEACRMFVPGLNLDREGERALPPIRMITGATVTGRVTVAGRVAGQIKVVLTTPATATSGRDALRLETVTDSAGAFRMPRRVPPGTYELRAAIVGTAEPEVQIFRQLLQMQRSSTTVVIGPGQRLVERDIDLPSDH